MQDPASFNLEVIKAKIEEAIRSRYRRSSYQYLACPYKQEVAGSSPALPTIPSKIVYRLSSKRNSVASAETVPGDGRFKPPVIAALHCTNRQTEKEVNIPERRLRSR